MAYLAFQEKKTIVGWDVDMAVNVYFEWGTLCENLIAPVINTRAMKGQKAVYLVAEPCNPINMGC